MNTDERLKVEKKNGVATILLNSPDTMNVLGSEMLLALASALGEIEKDAESRAVVITGVKTFCAGANIKEMKEKGPEEARTFAGLAHGIFHRMETMPKPVIAAVNGYALGGGCEMALACDIRIAAESAKFGQPEVNLGLIPGFGGTQRLPLLVGVGKAKELIMTGRIIDAREAEAIGLVNAVAGNEELTAKALEMALSIAGKSPLNIGMVKRLINKNFEIEKGLEMEVFSFSECFASEDRLEGMNAFLEKRKPVFKGL